MDSAIEKMVTLRKLEPLNEVYQLMLANIYLLGEKIEEAKWILENYNYNRFAIGERSTDKLLLSLPDCKKSVET